MRVPVLLSAFFSLVVLANVALGAECAKNAFASPNDGLGTYPLIRPHPEFSRTLSAAKTGDAAAQRSLAVSYENGYLVSPCDAKASYWYRLAAAGGDKIAKDWVALRDQLDKLRAGPECAADSCGINTGDMSQVLTLFSGGGGHFHSTLTINGVTVPGIIDTGATMVALDEKTAQQMGISLAGAKQGRATTANGVVATQNTVVSHLRVGGAIDLDNVPVSIQSNLGPTLIGMSVLRRLKISVSGGQMTLSKK